MYYDEYCYWAQVTVLLMYLDIGLLGQVIYRLCTKVELLVQRRLCPIFVRDVGSPGIHECFHGLMGSQRTPEIWGVTELLAVVYALDKVRAYLVGLDIIIFKNHSTLKYLLTKKNSKARLIKWVLLLQELNL